MSPLSPAEVTSGLRSEQIAGEFVPPHQPLIPEHFVQNLLFLKFLGWVLATHARTLPLLVDAARRQVNGWLLITDLRASPERAALPQDVVARVRVDEGQLVTVETNPAYRLFTDDGFMALPDDLAAVLRAELLALEPVAEPPV